MNIPLNKNSWSLCLLALWIEKKNFYGNHFVRHLGYNSFSKGFQ